MSSKHLHAIVRAAEHIHAIESLVYRRMYGNYVPDDRCVEVHADVQSAGAQFSQDSHTTNRCSFCKGTGFNGSFACLHCKGTGHIQ